MAILTVISVIWNAKLSGQRVQEKFAYFLVYGFKDFFM